MDQDQLDELEAISAIFTSDYCEVFADELASIVVAAGWAASEVKHLVQLKIIPEPDDKGDIHVGISLYGGMRPLYPAEQALLVYCKSDQGLSHSMIEELTAKLLLVSEENIGMPSIYTVVEAAKEWLQTNNLPGLDGSMYAEMMRREQLKEVEKKNVIHKAQIREAADNEKRAGEPAIDEAELERIRKRQAGTAVTMETFVQWKKAFDEELALKQALEKVAIEMDGEKMSGKQWFLSGRGEKDVEGEEDLIAQGEKEREIEGEEDEDDEEDEDYVEGEESEEDEDYEEEEA